MIAQEALVQLIGADLEYPVTYPLIGVLAEQHRRRVGVGPVAPVDLGFFQCQPAGSVRLPFEGVRRWPQPAVWPPVTSLIPARGTLADVAETTALAARHQAALPRERRHERIGSTVPASIKAAPLPGVSAWALPWEARPGARRAYACRGTLSRFAHSQARRPLAIASHPSARGPHRVSYTAGRIAFRPIHPRQKPEMRATRYLDLGFDYWEVWLGASPGVRAYDLHVTRQRFQYLLALTSSHAEPYGLRLGMRRASRGPKTSWKPQAANL
jgi:hypothetical protein